MIFSQLQAMNSADGEFGKQRSNVKNSTRRIATEHFDLIKIDSAKLFYST